MGVTGRELGGSRFISSMYPGISLNMDDPWSRYAGPIGGITAVDRAKYPRR
jgi:hypothetical protein